MTKRTLVDESTHFVLTHYDSKPEGKEGDDRSPFLVLISGPQGSGKTTSTHAIKQKLHELRPELKCLCVSIDDFYLTHADQQKVSNNNSGNGLQQGRGLPGTHDMRLLDSFMQRLHENKGSVHVPVYDKSLFGGEGDRSASADEVALPVDVVIVEGWFLGFEAVGEKTLEQMRSEVSSPRGKLLRTHELQHLLQVDSGLGAYARALWNNPTFRSVGVVIAADVANIYRWRQQQEAQMIAKYGSGMNEEQVKAFVLRYMPCYELYYRSLMEHGSLGTEAALVVHIDADRTVTGVEEKTRAA
ncbi:putative ATP-dependent kinase [Lachancea thermotolerans CBS 6340]|uniref:KLTH0B01452p n=1 Tax=Lachancea thermotolerans (strain ATCC 56472 / CBS 6340 / NRRL Y-8284) TaxID=559295 RepID=C5DCA4_LACTC|nr:KLTH0B01452p [Lachancea thermotolerans CBS 6340]CAR21415.1 KLTH0B01452p [Lachancea thermotolerans CBS 6340]